MIIYDSYKVFNIETHRRREENLKKKKLKWNFGADICACGNGNTSLIIYVVRILCTLQLRVYLSIKWTTMYYDVWERNENLPCYIYTFIFNIIYTVATLRAM